MVKYILKSSLWILPGAFLLALGLRLFLIPMKLSVGGISSIATALFYLFRLPLSVSTILLNGVLFLFGLRFLQKTAVLKTTLGILFVSLFLELPFFRLSMPDILSASVLGGLFSGLGIGLVIRQNASTGGSDFAALILHRFFPHISVSLLIMGIDLCIILASGFIFKSLAVTFYSALALFISMKATDYVLAFGNHAKAVRIISAKCEMISRQIHKDFERGTTGIYTKGMFTDENRLMLYTVVSPKELPAVLTLIRHVDSSAFVVISDVREVFGEGFRATIGF